MDSLIIAPDGYLFAYLSNETSSTPVYFDDLKVVHHTLIPQSQLASAQHTTLGGNLVNQYLYQSKELQNETQWYDFGYRMYDPYTTRWNAVDPLTEATIALSPYHFVYNNPVNFVDPDGRYPRDCAFGWNPDTGHCFSNPGPATYGQENDPCGGVPECYDRGGSPMKAIDYLSQNPFADTEHYDRYLREFYGYNETSYGTGRQEYVPYGTLVMAGNSVFIRHEGFHVVERNGGFRFRGMISAVQSSERCPTCPDSDSNNPISEYNWLNLVASEAAIAGGAATIVANNSRPLYTGIKAWESTKQGATRLGRRFGYVGLALTAVDMGTNGINTSNSLDATFGVIGFFGPIGAGISGAYFVSNLITVGITERSIGEHADDYIWIPNPSGMGVIPIGKKQK